MDELHDYVRLMADKLRDPLWAANIYAASVHYRMGYGKKVDLSDHEQEACRYLCGPARFVVRRAGKPKSGLAAAPKSFIGTFPLALWCAHDQVTHEFFETMRRNTQRCSLLELVQRAAWLYVRPINEVRPDMSHKHIL